MISLLSKLQYKTVGVRTFFYFSGVFFMANLNALIAVFLHPEIPYFDKEHLIVGSASAFVTAALFIVLSAYVGKLKFAEERKRDAEIMAEKEKLLSDLKAAVEKAEDEKARSEGIIAAIGDGITIQDLDFKIIYQNEVAIKMVGSHIGEYCYMAYEKRAQRCEGCPVAMVFADGKIHRTERTAPVERGLIIVENTASPLRDSTGKIIGGIEVIREITERKRAEEAIRESEAKFRSYVEHAPSAVFVLDRTGRCVDFNPAAVQLLGYDASVLPGMSIPEFVPNEDLDLTLRDFEILFKQGHIEGAYRLRRRDGAVIWVSVRAVKVRDDRIMAFIQDITERKHAENALRENEEQYRLLFDSNPHPMWVFDFETLAFIAVNDAAINHYGYSRDEFLAMTIKDIRPEEDITYLLEVLSKAKPGLEQSGNLRHKKKDGTIIWVEINSHGVHFGKVRARLVMAIDVTDRKRAEEALRESEERLRAIIDNAKGVVWVKDLEGRYLITNRYFEELLGKPREQVVGRTAFDLFPRHIAKEFTSHDHEVVQSGVPLEFEESPVLRNGQQAAYLSVKFPLRDSSGRISALGAICTDITARILAENALHDSERNYRSLVDNALVGVYRSTLDGQFLYVNDAMTRIFECESPEEMLKQKVEIRYKNAEDRKQFTEKLKRHGNLSNYEIEAPTKSGRLITVLISAALAGDIITGMILDITDYKKLMEQLRQAQKIEAIGLLAGGVAHDFNNILSAIIGYTHLNLMKMPEDDPLRYNLEQILESSNRATVLTQSLLAFSRKQPVRLAVIDLNEVIQGFSKFLLRLIREDISLKTLFEEKNLYIMADRGHIEQVLMNLVTNARDAMPNGGKLLVETKLVGLNRGFVKVHGYGKEGEYALMSVSDTGIGMDEQTKSRIFEPFFTTKEQGKGTGLGLSMVYGLIKEHEGFINAYSEPGNGTTFKIYLPIARSAATPAILNARQPITAQRGSEIILMAEDDAALRELNTTWLRQFGYTVIEATDGADAVSKFEDNKEAINLIILDGIMPRLSGKEAFKKIKAISPDIKCIFMSGYAEEIFTKDGLPSREAEFILKPAAPSDLLKKIREILDH